MRYTPGGTHSGRGAKGSKVKKYHYPNVGAAHSDRDRVSITPSIHDLTKTIGSMEKTTEALEKELVGDPILGTSC